MSDNRLCIHRGIVRTRVRLPQIKRSSGIHGPKPRPWRLCLLTRVQHEPGFVLGCIQFPIGSNAPPRGRGAVGNWSRSDLSNRGWVRSLRNVANAASEGTKGNAAVSDQDLNSFVLISAGSARLL